MRAKSSDAPDAPVGRDGLYSSRCKARWQHWPHVARVAPTARKDSHPEQLPTDIGHTDAQTMPQRAPRSAWARLLAKVYEVDPLICPRYRSEMKLIALITNPREVAKILRHLINIGKAPPGFDPSSVN